MILTNLIKELKDIRAERLTPYDMAVYIAICSIYKAGNEYFTDRQVLEVMGEC